MESITSLFAQHGLLALWVRVFVEQIGAPVPAMPFLFLPGIASAGDAVFAVKAVIVASSASMLADSLWFYAGRRFGRRVLALLCRISISPDSCVRQSELSFARRGVVTLVIAKFIPGLSTLASPLAGAIGMRTSSFALFIVFTHSKPASFDQQHPENFVAPIAGMRSLRLSRHSIAPAKTALLQSTRVTGGLLMQLF